MDARALLERHNPILVIFPQDPARDRPGARRPARGWGDYHPCNAEFFLDRVHRRDRPTKYDWSGALLSRFRRTWSPLEADRIDALRALVTAKPEISRPWEVDLCDIPSQDEAEAWRAYGRYLRGEPADGEAFRSVVYGRYAESPSGRALQYWYLYTYNDFFNNHEADWEMVTIELDADDQPVNVGYSNHHGGLRIEWARAPRDGDRPIVYVARGSHAGYLDYKRGGHALGGELGTGNLPRALAFLKPVRALINQGIRYVQRLPGVRLFRDNAPADPLRDTGASRNHYGVRHTPALEVLPDPRDVTADSPYWWLLYQGCWGSTRPRLSGSVGIPGPWASPSSKDLRWPDPVAWLRSCVFVREYAAPAAERARATSGTQSPALAEASEDATEARR